MKTYVMDMAEAPKNDRGFLTYDYIKHVFPNTPEYFGQNYNALIDILRYPGEVLPTDDVEIYVLNTAQSILGKETTIDLLNSAFDVIKEDWDRATADVSGNPLPRKLKFNFEIVN